MNEELDLDKLEEICCGASSPEEWKGSVGAAGHDNDFSYGPITTKEQAEKDSEFCKTARLVMPELIEYARGYEELKKTIEGTLNTLKMSNSIIKEIGELVGFHFGGHQSLVDFIKELKITRNDILEEAAFVCECSNCSSRIREELMGESYLNYLEQLKKIHKE